MGDIKTDVLDRETQMKSVNVFLTASTEAGAGPEGKAKWLKRHAKYRQSWERSGWVPKTALKEAHLRRVEAWPPTPQTLTPTTLPNKDQTPLLDIPPPPYPTYSPDVTRDSYSNPYPSLTDILTDIPLIPTQYDHGFPPLSQTKTPLPQTETTIPPTTLQTPVLNIPERNLQPGSSVNVTWDCAYEDNQALDQEWRPKIKEKAHRAPAQPQPPPAARRRGICGPMGAILPQKHIHKVPTKAEKTSTYRDTCQKKKDDISTTGDSSPSSSPSSEEDVPAHEKMVKQDKDLATDDGEDKACRETRPRRRHRSHSARRANDIPTHDVFAQATGLSETNQWLAWLIGTVRLQGLSDCVACAAARPALTTVPVYLNATDDSRGTYCMLRLFMEAHPKNCTLLGNLFPPGLNETTPPTFTARPASYWCFTRVAPVRARRDTTYPTSFDLTENSPCYIDAIGIPRGVPNEYKLADQIGAGFENIPILSGLFPITPNKNVDRINYIHYNVQRLANLTRDAVEGISTQLAATSLMAFQNRVALDMLLAEKGGVCAMFGDQCCTFIPNNTAPDGSVTKALNGLRALSTELKEASGLDNPLEVLQNPLKCPEKQQVLSSCLGTMLIRTLGDVIRP
ncbi:ERV-BabFcenv provirus ancestral Env polyprotein [Merluccius polli]|uniref:ERV-BabFcenv provirus ancestral Env polyprotein n=1 Tax=Merluccius polli TaxID=89951 RepID=A0AA47NPG2_MERPO|nr:ERV-BabFcenv provirus ancestral Env polyprotein [Merluccius polli]